MFIPWGKKGFLKQEAKSTNHKRKYFLKKILTSVFQRFYKQSAIYHQAKEFNSYN